MLQALKDSTNKQNENKDTINILIQTKKTSQESKKSAKMPVLKENKETKALKPILKEPTESLGKLKLGETTTYSEQSTRIINYSKIEKQLQVSVCMTPRLPEDIEDIDAGDNNSPLLMSIYIKDIYNYLTELEVKYAIEPDHLKKQVFNYIFYNFS